MAYEPEPSDGEYVCAEHSVELCSMGLCMRDVATVVPVAYSACTVGSD